MENIIYKDTKDLDMNELQRLFLSVSWSSGKYPELLKSALANYGSVFTAWHNGKMVGLIGSMDDGIMTAYIHYLLVDPDYQGKGIGRKLIDMTKQYYEKYLRIVLVAYENAIGFYQSCGFKDYNDSCPMYITEMDD
ncbi:MAG: GNAT family N-acetyltransferase [Prevotella sp.]